MAVGSNASAAVLGNKFRSAGIDCGDVTARMARVSVADLGVSHSAHVAARGYIPAAPYRLSGAHLRTVGAWLFPTELVALDATEPNYLRKTVSPDRHPLTLSGRPRRTPFDLYLSRHGVLGDAPAHRLRFGEQAAAQRWLHERTADDALSGTAEAVCTSLSDSAVAHRVQSAIGRLDLSRDAGFPATTFADDTAAVCR